MKRDAGGPDEAPEPGIADLVEMDLIVPIRTSGGGSRGASRIQASDPSQVGLQAMRHGTDAHGRFLAAFTSPRTLAKHGPPGSDSVTLAARELFALADEAGERVLIDPGSAAQVEIATGVLPFLVAGIDPATPEALRARRPLGGLPQLEAPSAVPEPFGTEMRTALTELTEVRRAWLLRAGAGWTVGIELSEEAPLSEFDAVRNRLHALAAEYLGSRRELIVTDLRAHALRERYASIAPPYYEPVPPQRGFFDRLLGREG